MTSILSVAAGKLNIADGGKNYVLDGNKLMDGTTEVADAAAKKGIVERALGEIESKKGSLSKDVRAQLASSMNGFISAGADKARVEVLEGNFKAAKNIATAAGSNDHAAISKELLNNEGVVEYLGHDGVKSLRTSGFDFAKLDRYKSAQNSLKAFVDAEKIDVTAIKKHLIDNFEHIDHLKVGSKQLNALYLKGSNFDYNKLVSEVKTGVDDAHSAIKPLMSDIKAKSASLKSLNGKALEKAKGELVELEKKYTEAVKSDYSHVAISKIHAAEPDLVKGAREASKVIDTHAEVALKSVEKAADKGMGFWGKVFKYTKGEKMGKINPWKTGGVVVGGLIVVKAITAAVGKKGKAADINQEQQQAQLEAEAGQARA